MLNDPYSILQSNPSFSVLYDFFCTHRSFFNPVGFVATLANFSPLAKQTHFSFICRHTMMQTPFSISAHPGKTTTSKVYAPPDMYHVYAAVSIGIPKKNCPELKNAQTEIELILNKASAIHAKQFHQFTATIVSTPRETSPNKLPQQFEKQWVYDAKFEPHPSVDKTQFSPDEFYDSFIKFALLKGFQHTPNNLPVSYPRGYVPSLSSEIKSEWVPYVNIFLKANNNEHDSAFGVLTGVPPCAFGNSLSTGKTQTPPAYLGFLPLRHALFSSLHEQMKPKLDAFGLPHLKNKAVFGKRVGLRFGSYRKDGKSPPSECIYITASDEEIFLKLANLVNESEIELTVFGTPSCFIPFPVYERGDFQAVNAEKDLIISANTTANNDFKSATRVYVTTNTPLPEAVKANLVKRKPYLLSVFPVMSPANPNVPEYYKLFVQTNPSIDTVLRRDPSSLFSETIFTTVSLTPPLSISVSPATNPQTISVKPAPANGPSKASFMMNRLSALAAARNADDSTASTTLSNSPSPEQHQNKKHKYSKSATKPAPSPADPSLVAPCNHWPPNSLCTTCTSYHLFYDGTILNQLTGEPIDVEVVSEPLTPNAEQMDVDDDNAHQSPSGSSTDDADYSETSKALFDTDDLESTPHPDCSQLTNPEELENEKKLPKDIRNKFKSDRATYDAYLTMYKYVPSEHDNDFHELIRKDLNPELIRQIAYTWMDMSKTPAKSASKRKASR